MEYIIMKLSNNTNNPHSLFSRCINLTLGTDVLQSSMQHTCICTGARQVDTCYYELVLK